MKWLGRDWLAEWAIKVEEFVSQEVNRLIESVNFKHFLFNAIRLVAGANQVVCLTKNSHERHDSDFLSA